jgi:two-component system, NtrC family, sensor kinase
VQAGLRLQIVLALAGLMVLAFVPLFFAVASLTRASIAGARSQSARVLGHAIAVHVAQARAADEAGAPGSLQRAAADQVERGGAEAICVVSADGSMLAVAGSTWDVSQLRNLRGAPDSVWSVHGAEGHGLDVISEAAGLRVFTRLRMDGGTDRGAPLVELVALYMIVFALALMVFAYFALTRLIVRPVEQLVGAADRVASGARTLRVPRHGARELVELGASVQAMAEKLISEEAALILKVEELTDATRRLTDTRAQLVRSERMASVGRLAAGLAHEIGNPIAALMGMEDLLLEGGLDPDAEKDFLGRMRRETERIHVVIRDLLDFARPEGSTEPRTPATPADVRSTVDDVVSLARPQKPFRNVRIETAIDPGIEVGLPAPKLTQVLLNLVLNAGSALAEAKRDPGHIVIRASRRDGGGVRIEVEDDGPGISPAIRDRLFEPFATTKPVGEGTGLGLAVCRGLVESAGGEVGVESPEHGGARFYVLLPVAPVPVA